MRVYDSLEAIAESTFERGSVIAIGKFDGVHRGHQALLARVAQVAEQQGYDPLVFTFANNPLSYLHPELSPVPVMSVGQRLDALAAAGVASCVMVPFDARLAEMSAEDFIERVLVDLLHTRHVCLGDDFRFGHGGEGDHVLLETIGEARGFTVEVLDDVEDEDLGRLSSTRLREAILQGDVRLAARIMGRRVALRGTVVHGDARGRELGFPTANIGGVIEGLRPADGVYAGFALVGGQRHAAAISVGANVTFDPEGEPRVEAFLLDFAGELYGEAIELQFVERLRGMVAFPNIDTLIARMSDDVRETRIILAGE